MEENQNGHQEKEKSVSVTAVRLYNNVCGVAELGYFGGLGYIKISPVAAGKEGTYDRDTYNYRAGIFFQLDVSDLQKIERVLELVEAAKSDGRFLSGSFAHKGAKGAKVLTIGCDLETQDGKPSDIYVMLQEWRSAADLDSGADPVNQALTVMAPDPRAGGVSFSEVTPKGEKTWTEDLNAGISSLREYCKVARLVCMKFHELSGAGPAPRASADPGRGDNIPPTIRRRGLPEVGTARPAAAAPPPPARPAAVAAARSAPPRPAAATDEAVSELFGDDD